MITVKHVIIITINPKPFTDYFYCIFFALSYNDSCIWSQTVIYGSVPDVCVRAFADSKLNNLLPFPGGMSAPSCLCLWAPASPLTMVHR